MGMNGDGSEIDKIVNPLCAGKRETLGDGADGSDTCILGAESGEARCP